MIPDEISASDDAHGGQPGAEYIGALVHPHQLEVQEWSSYAAVIDARSPREFAEDHIPGAMNLPVVDNDQYAQVGTRHRTDPHAAYLIGVEYSLQNIAAQIKPLISTFKQDDRLLVYCFRGGKRSRLWADNLRTIGFQVDVLAGGWKNYRRWVRSGLDTLPRMLTFKVLCGPTGCGKTRVLQALSVIGEQVLDLEALACHRGSLLGDLPDLSQPTQKLFDSRLLEVMRAFDAARPVWIEAESKRIGYVQIPESLYEAMSRAAVINLDAPMPERVRLWREDYPHFTRDPVAMVGKLKPIVPLVGKKTFGEWEMLAAEGRVDELFEAVMTQHYDPCYARSTRRQYGPQREAESLALQRLQGPAFDQAVRAFAARASIR